MNEQSKEMVDTLRSVAHTYEEAGIGPSSVGLMRQAAARIEYLERERVQAYEAIGGLLMCAELSTKAYERGALWMNQSGVTFADRNATPAQESSVKP